MHGRCGVAGGNVVEPREGAVVREKGTQRDRISWTELIAFHAAGLAKHIPAVGGFAPKLERQSLHLRIVAVDQDVLPLEYVELAHLPGLRLEKLRRHTRFISDI